MKKKVFLPSLIVLAVLILDQGLKIWIKTNLVLHEEYRIFSWFRIHFLENEGMAFGLSFGGETGKVILSLLRIALVGLIIWYIWDVQKKNERPVVIVTLSLILAGAIGNIIDSCFYGMIFSESYFQAADLFPDGGGYGKFLQGKVVDMFYFPLFSGTYPSWFPFKGGDYFLFFRPVFNIADSAISVGVIWFFGLQLFSKNKNVAK